MRRDGCGPWTCHRALIRSDGAVGVVARTRISGVQLLLLKLELLLLHVLLLELLLLLLEYVRVVERVRGGYAYCWVVHEKVSKGEGVKIE